MAKLSKGAFYHHFSCKNDIYEEAVSTFFLEPLNDLDTGQMASMKLKTMRKILGEHYAALPERISTTANIDMARYFASFFEALSRLPDRKSTRLNSSHTDISRMPSSA